ncbi:MAG: hypothetical protein PF638_10985 [Candidatus Delongbacteria bacterium]|jgi:tetratricopeptide (TPR) repeat protein|nr:hypothetical protein [Candidatus Delongbacteria bacterium]
MLLKPFSTSWKISYLEFLMQSYFIKLPDMGPKKVNLKGINRINEANFKNHKNLDEKQLIERNFEKMNFSKTLINSETDHAKRLLEHRTIDEDQGEEIKIQKYTMNDYGAIFSIELFDMLWINEIKNGELTEDLDVIKDSMTFSEHNKELSIFEESATKYSKYLDNPTKTNLLDESLQGFNKSIEGYKENPIAYFYLGLIYHHPSDLFDLDKSMEAFKNAEKYALENEEKVFAAYIDYILGWIYYIKGNIDEAIKVSLNSLDKDSIILSETYFNLAKFYAIKNDAVNAIKYLDIAVANADNFYTLKADIDDDFIPIKEELEKYFTHLRDEARKIVDSALSEFGISLKSSSEIDVDPSAETTKKNS